MKCANCNADLNPRDRFCGECGHPQALPTASPQSPTPASTPEAAAKRRRWAYVLATLVGIAVLGALGFIFLGQQSGETALMRAAMVGDTPTAKALIADGADVNVKDKHGWTALMRAASLSEKTDTVKALIAAGADVNVKDELGRTVLDVAKLGGVESRAEIVRILQEAGAQE